MGYKFYGAGTKKVKPISDIFASIEDQYHLYRLLSSLWSRETCAPRMREKWSEDNITLGQCSITAFLVQDIFGGEVYGISLGDGSFHYFNRIGDVEFDLTSEQFGDKHLDYQSAIPQRREDHFAKKEKSERYKILKAALIEKLSAASI